MFGVEAVVKRELSELGYVANVVQPGSLEFDGDSMAMCRTNIQLRTAERVLICVGRFPASDFDMLFDQTRALPWHEWIPHDGSFPVSGKSVKSQLSSVPACQRAVKKAIVEKLLASHGVERLPETGPRFSVEVGLLDDVATLTIDTTGDGLHKRGYRPLTGPAPLRETLAAALVALSVWRAERPLIDPFCGTGTIPIEAAMMARRIAPGVRRDFAAESWASIDKRLWSEARDEARDLEVSELQLQITGTDNDDRALSQARHHAQLAGVADDIHFQRRDFKDLSSKRRHGCVICNPPYGQRISDRATVDQLYASFPLILRRLPTWSHFVLTSYPHFESVVGQKATRRRKLYNGRIECQYFQFLGPRPQDHRSRSDTDREDRDSEAMPSETDAAAESKESRHDRPRPSFGGLRDEANRQASEFQNRLRKRARHLRRWPSRGITCYRLYERDIPEIPLVVDRYEDHLHIAEFVRPHERTRAEHADWIDLLTASAAEALDIDRNNVFVKTRDRQRGSRQYERVASAGRVIDVQENGLMFRVNLSDYLDTGLFLDHRITRQMVRDVAADTRMINLFGYTGSFSVYAAAGGASTTTTVDSSRAYLTWAQENLEINGLAHAAHRQVRADAMDYLRDLDRDVRFDLAVVDPPTFSNSKDLNRDWDVQRDYVELLRRLANHMTGQGIIFFSTNFRRFKLSEGDLPHLHFHEISRQTVPEDFRNRRIHRCWRITLR